MAAKHKFALLALIAVLALIVACIVAYDRFICDSEEGWCRFHLTQIGTALLNYKELHGTFPPAFTCDSAGHPINSSRAEVIPNFWYNFRHDSVSPARDDDAGGPSYDYSEPWNGPKNAKLHLDQKQCPEFQCPSDHPLAAATTNYVAVVGPNTMWPGAVGAAPAADGSDSEKILVLEFPGSDILWMEPRDLSVDQALDLVKSTQDGRRSASPIHYLTVLGAVRTLDPNIDEQSLRKLLERDVPSSHRSTRQIMQE